MAKLNGSTQIGVQSVEPAIKLLLALASLSMDTPPPMLKKIAATANLSPAKAHRYLVSLTRMQMVERDAASGRYRLGPNARLVGVASIRGSDVVRAASARLGKLCEDAQHSAALAVWTEYGPAIVWVEEVRRRISVSTRIGEILPLLNSASGHVFGAWLPRFHTQELLLNEIAVNRKSRSKRGIKNMAEVERLMERVREKGLGWSFGDTNSTVNALAAPIFDYRSSLVGAMALLGPSDSFPAKLNSSLADLLRAAAREVSESLGYQPETGLVQMNAPAKKQRQQSLPGLTS